jgi:hypothetical protein
MMERYYDAHLYVTNWGTHQVMLRLPRALLSLEAAEQYCIDPYVAAWTSGEHVLLDLTSEGESGTGLKAPRIPCRAIVGARAELAAGDPASSLPGLAGGPRNLGTRGGRFRLQRRKTNSNHRFPLAWERSPRHSAPWPTSSASTPTCSRPAAQASPPLAQAKDDPRKLARWIKDMPANDKDTLLHWGCPKAKEP